MCFGSNGNRASHISDNDFAVISIEARRGHIGIAHHNLCLNSITLCHRQCGLILTALESQRCSIRGSCISQVVGDVIDINFLFQHSTDHTLRNSVHTLMLGMQTITHSNTVICTCRDAFQIHESSSQQFSHSFQFVVSAGQACIRATASQHAQAVDLCIRILLHSLMQHNGISFADCSRCGICILAIISLHKQRILVNGSSSTPFGLAIAVVIGTHIHPNIIRVLVPGVMELFAACFIGCSCTTSVCQYCAGGPRVVDAQLHAQSINSLLPPGVVQRDAKDWIIQSTTTEGCVVIGVVRNAGKGRDTISQDRYLLAFEIRSCNCMFSCENTRGDQ